MISFSCVEIGILKDEMLPSLPSIFLSQMKALRLVGKVGTVNQQPAALTPCHLSDFIKTRKEIGSDLERVNEF